MTNEAERLNNAIVRLDWLQGSNAEIAELTRDWRGWFDRARMQTPDGSAAWRNALQFYELRYRAAYARAYPAQGVQTVSAQGEPISQTPTQQLNTQKNVPLGVALGALGMLGLMLVLRKG